MRGRGGSAGRKNSQGAPAVWQAMDVRIKGRDGS